MMEIYIKGDTIGDLLQMKENIITGGYKGKILIIPTYKLKEWIEENSPKTDGGFTVSLVSQIIGLDVIGDFIIDK